MNYVGVDYSLNSTAVCIYSNGSYKWFSFAKDYNPNYKRSQYHLKINNLDNGTVKPVHRERSKDYRENERLKLVCSHQISDQIIEAILNEIGDQPFMLGMEGYSYGSKGNSFIDLIGYATVLRHKLYVKYPDCGPYIYSPSEIKKYVGKGNYNKLDMYEAFTKNVFKDPDLSIDPLWKLSKEKNILNKKKKNTDVRKPFDDLIDAYFICHYLKSNA